MTIPIYLIQLKQFEFIKKIGKKLNFMNPDKNYSYLTFR